MARRSGDPSEHDWPTAIADLTITIALVVIALATAVWLFLLVAAAWAAIGYAQTRIALH